MKLFTVGEVQSVMDARMQGRTMSAICHLMHMHTRDEVVEVIDAILRTDTAWDAMKQVNGVIRMQEAGVPMINGREAWRICHDKGRTSYAPQF